MVTRVIFVDFDGVLNDLNYLMGSHDGELDPFKISILAAICSRTNAKVVLTSSWRDDMKARRLLVKNGIPLLGATPHKRDNRGLEIKQWLIDKKFTGEWIIIDDECSELSKKQRERLILTRENTTPLPTLGLQYKHIKWAESMFTKDLPQETDMEFLAAILSDIENELLRVMWNINQEEYDHLDPFQNTGNVPGYSNDTFEVHAYDWGWDFDDNHTPQPFNFRWRDFQVTWYKRMGRGMNTNRSITHDELALMHHECMESLREYEKEHDNFYK